MRSIKNFQTFFTVIIVLFAFSILLKADISSGDCVAIISKQAVSADGVEFPFTTDAPEADDFVLLSGESKDILFGDSGSFVVVEEVPEFWQLDGVECGTPEGNITYETIENGIMFTCPSGMNSIECTFINSVIPKPVTNIPTLSQWGLIAMAGVLGIVGFFAIRRRAVTA